MISKTRCRRGRNNIRVRTLGVWNNNNIIIRIIYYRCHPLAHNIISRSSCDTFTVIIVIIICESVRPIMYRIILFLVYSNGFTFNKVRLLSSTTSSPTSIRFVLCYNDNTTSHLTVRRLFVRVHVTKMSQRAKTTCNPLAKFVFRIC